MLTGIIGNTVDGMVIGSGLGVEAMAAYGFTSSVTLLVAIVGSVMSTGSAVVCSKTLGSGDIEKTRYAFAVCLTMVVSVCLVIELFFYEII